MAHFGFPPARFCPALIQLATAKKSVPCKKTQQSFVSHSIIELMRLLQEQLFFLLKAKGCLVPWDGYLLVNGWIRCLRGDVSNWNKMGDLTGFIQGRLFVLICSFSPSSCLSCSSAMQSSLDWSNILSLRLKQLSSCSGSFIVTVLV